ncbi:MAG: immune inhibitor A, partial [Chloroflexota bacterium]
IEMSIWTWYDIETDWDYIYLSASIDGGAHWKIITTPSGTDEDALGNSYGWAYNDVSRKRKWIQENIDLTEFAGEELTLRFDYVTDSAVNGEGMLIDDISISAIDYFTDFEDDNGGWDAEGWVRVSNILPQTFEIAMYNEGTGEVDYLNLNPDNTLDIPLDIGKNNVVLVVVGTTRFTRQLANYSVSFK